MKIRLSELTNSKGESNNKIVLIIILGTLEALKARKITTREAELVIFSPSALEIFNDLDIDQKILEIIHKGFFLEDIESLIPDKLAKELADLQEETLKLMETCDEVQPYY